jgi:hypothetical protein
MLRRMRTVAEVAEALSVDIFVLEGVSWKACGSRCASMKAGSLTSCDRETIAPWK